MVLVQSLGELENSRRGLQALVEDTALALQAHVLGPLDIASQISGGLNITTKAEVLGTALKESIVAGLLSLLISRGSGSLSLDFTLAFSLWL